MGGEVEHQRLRKLRKIGKTQKANNTENSKHWNFENIISSFPMFGSILAVLNLVYV